jgi:hypothetical protein
VSTPQPPTNGDSARRVRREARAVRQRQIARGIAILLALLLVTGAVLLLTGVIDTSSARPTLAARAGDPPGAEPATATSTPAKAKARCRRHRCGSGSAATRWPARSARRSAT